MGLSPNGVVPLPLNRSWNRAMVGAFLRRSRYLLLDRPLAALHGNN